MTSTGFQPKRGCTMHSSSAQRLQRIRVITSNLLKSMHGFRLLSLQHGSRIRLGILFVILVLVGGQILLWRTSVSRMVAQALQAPTNQEVRAPAKELIAPLSQSPITRIEVPAADIYTSVVGIGPITAASQQGTTWQLSVLRWGTTTIRGNQVRERTSSSVRNRAHKATSWRCSIMYVRAVSSPCMWVTLHIRTRSPNKCLSRQTHQT